MKAQVIKDKILGDRGYMPATLDECLTQLSAEFDSASINKIKNGSEEDLGQYQFFGEMWIRNRFDLRGHSQLAQTLEAIGLKDPSYTSKLILHSYWRRLNGLPLNIDEQIRKYNEEDRLFRSNQNGSRL